MLSHRMRWRRGTSSEVRDIARAGAYSLKAFGHDSVHVEPKGEKAVCNEDRSFEVTIRSYRLWRVCPLVFV